MYCFAEGDVIVTVRLRDSRVNCCSGSASRLAGSRPVRYRQCSQAVASATASSVLVSAMPNGQQNEPNVYCETLLNIAHFLLCVTGDFCTVTGTDVCIKINLVLCLLT